jgi:hypothetical protein
LQVAVLLHLLRDHRAGVAVERAHGEVERGPRERDRELGGLARRFAVARLALNEARADLGLRPRCIVEPAVDDDRLVEREGAERWALAATLGRRWRGIVRERGRGEQRSQHRWHQRAAPEARARSAAFRRRWSRGGHRSGERATPLARERAAHEHG